MKQCAEDMELKLQGNKQSVVYSGIKNIVKTSSGKKNTDGSPKSSKIMQAGFLTSGALLVFRHHGEPALLEWFGPTD